MRGRLIDLSIGLNRKQRITIEVDRDFREDFDRLKEAELDVEIKKHRNRRIFLEKLQCFLAVRSKYSFVSFFFCIFR